jgi:hypothetical protein
MNRNVTRACLGNIVAIPNRHLRSACLNKKMSGETVCNGYLHTALLKQFYNQEVLMLTISHSLKDMMILTRVYFLQS